MRTYLFHKGGLIQGEEDSTEEPNEPSCRDGIFLSVQRIDQVLHVIELEDVVESDLIERFLEKSEIPVFHPGSAVS